MKKPTTKKRELPMPKPLTIGGVEYAICRVGENGGRLIFTSAQLSHQWDTITTYRAWLAEAEEWMKRDPLRTGGKP